MKQNNISLSILKQDKRIMRVFLIVILLFFAYGSFVTVKYVFGKDEFFHVVQKIRTCKGEENATAVLKNVNIEARSHDSHNSTPLVWFAGLGDIDAVRVLLKLGADTTAKNRMGKTAAGMAKLAGHDDVYLLLTGSHISDSNEESPESEKNQPPPTE